MRRLADWFGTSPTRPSLHVERIVGRLGATCVPLLGRELASADPHRTAAARAALADLAATSAAARARVIAELRRTVDAARSDATDATKVTALGLLSELGERGTARFADPSAIQRSSALALASQLDTPADVASAADLMVTKLSEPDMVQLVSVMASAAPAAAHRVAAELCARVDLADDLRERIAEVALVQPAPAEPAPRRAVRPSHAYVLVDAAERTVVVAIRKVSGERRWRRWAVLIERAHVDDCLHEEQAGTEAEAAALVQSLVADGYRVASTDVDHARARVAEAARASVAATGALPASYYLGRDLLDLGDAHVSRLRGHATTALGRAHDLIDAGDVARARGVLARCDVALPEVAAALAACWLAEQRHAEAIPLLVHASELEPAWPLHHWNLAAAYHAIGDSAACYQALRRFIAASGERSALVGDPDQPGRVALASRLMAELERHARLVAAPRTGRRARRRKS